MEKYYDHYTTRARNGLGVKAKMYQSRRIFALGIDSASKDRKNVLEIGPGDGNIAQLATIAGHDYLGVEASASIATSLRHRGFKIYEGFAPPLPLDVEHIDVCYALHVIEHMKDAQNAKDFVTAVADKMPKGGKLVIATPDLLRWGPRFYDSDYTHILPFTRRKLNALITAGGLKVTHESIYVGPVFGLAGVPFAWFASKLFTASVDDVLSRILSKDIACRALYTILPNLITVATKD